MSKDPYHILGVSKNASDSDIKKAYRALAKKYHPDRTPNNRTIAEKFRSISAAYDILGDRKKRTQFDRGEIDATGQPSAGAWPPRGHFTDTFHNTDGDIFSSVFRQRRQERRVTPQKGTDIDLDLTLPFQDAVIGGQHAVRLPIGKTVNVKIPPGIEENQTIRLKGQGSPGLYGGPSGDVLLKVHVTPDPDMTRIGDDLEVRTLIPLEIAVLGGKSDIRTIHGSVTMTVPRHTSSGTRLRLKGKGIRRKDGTYGDLFAVIHIILPDPPDQELERFLQRRQTSQTTYAV